jgi:hypothetical protein
LVKLLQGSSGVALSQKHLVGSTWQPNAPFPTSSYVQQSEGSGLFLLSWHPPKGE